MPSFPNFDGILTGHPGLRHEASESELRAFEELYSVQLPPILREFYRYTNGLDLERIGSEIRALTNSILKHGHLCISGTANYDLWVRLEGPLQDYVWLQDLYSGSPILYAFRNLATGLSAYQKSNGLDWDEVSWELDTQEYLPQETEYAEQTFCKWLQPDDDWEYLLGRLSHQRTADLQVALQFATESQLQARLYLKFDPTVRGEFASRLGRFASVWAQEFLSNWQEEITNNEDIRTFSEQCAAALQAAGIPAHAKWKRVFLEGHAKRLDIQAVFHRRHELGFFDELTHRIQALL